jgi:hypothetical protein
MVVMCLFYNFELYVFAVKVLWSKAGDDRYTLEQSLIKVLKNPSATYDHDQTLILCQLYNFSFGILFLYEEKKM